MRQCGSNDSPRAHIVVELVDIKIEGSTNSTFSPGDFVIEKPLDCNGEGGRATDGLIPKPRVPFGPLGDYALAQLTPETEQPAQKGNGPIPGVWPPRLTEQPDEDSEQLPRPGESGLAILIEVEESLLAVGREPADIKGAQVIRATAGVNL